jgi:large subunit ribosomal protein L13
LVEVIDATGLVAGRLASIAAKKALEGERVEIVNAEMAVVSGEKSNTLRDFKQKRDRGDSMHGPYYPRRADLILRRIIRGMLPYKRERGKVAMRNTKVHLGCPEELKQKAKTIESINYKKMKIQRFISLKELSFKLGSRP